MKNFEEIRQQESRFMMPVYARWPVAPVSGQGSWATDEAGRKYLDFGSGIGVNSLGFAEPGWVHAVSKQAGTLQHCSNLYYSPVQIALAEKLCTLSGFDKVFFANSGAEANECAIKLARKYSFDQYGAGRHNIISLQNSFHGRTITTLAATGQDGFHKFFDPFTEGFRYASAGDLDALAELTDDTVCAVMLEVVQGEGGVLPLAPDYLRAVEEFCRQRDILLICDEVQTGIGRTGKLFAYEHAGLQPDIVTSAKGLGGGLPIGACLCRERLGGVLSAGTHGTTFGGNPVACAGALYVLEQVGSKEFLAEVAKKGALIRRRAEKMEGAAEVRSLGMMAGILPKYGDAKQVAADCLSEGLIVLTAKNMVRLLPPLNISEEDLSAGLEILERVLAAQQTKGEV